MENAKKEDEITLSDLELDDFDLDSMELDDIDLADIDIDFPMEGMLPSETPDPIEETALPQEDSLLDDFNLEDMSLLEEGDSEEVEIAEESSPEELESLSDEDGMDDIENLLKSMDNMDDVPALEDEPSEEDVMADVEDLLGMLNQTEEQPAGNAEDTEGDFFSLDGLMNMEEEEDDDDMLLFDAEHYGSEEGKEHSNSESDALEDNLMGILDGSQEEREARKKSAFEKIFGNIHDAKSKRAHEKMLSNEEKKALKKKEKEEKKAAKKALKNDPAYKAEQEAKKKEKEEKKAQAKALKEAKKKEREEKRQQRLAEEEAEAKEDQGRINRVGAGIVFVCLGVFAASVIFGSNHFSYNQSVAQAEEYFGNREYTEAYNEVRGMKIKAKDSEIYDKIVVVMYVNKQLNSYNNYYAMRMYPEALDSLLKGLQKYDAYSMAGEQLGVSNDLDYVKNQIVSELQDTFSLNETNAYAIINSATQEDYSQKVIAAAQQ